MSKNYRRRTVLGYLSSTIALNALHIPPAQASLKFPEINHRIAGNISITSDRWYIKGRLYFHLTPQGYSCGIEINEHPKTKPIYEMHTSGLITKSGLAPLKTISTKRIDHWIFLGGFFPIPYPAYKHETITSDYVLSDGKISRIYVERIEEGRNKGNLPKSKERHHEQNNFEGLDYVSSIFFLLSLLRDGQMPEKLTTLSEWGKKEENQVIIKELNYNNRIVTIHGPETSIDRLEIIVDGDSNLEHVRLSNEYGRIDVSDY